VLKSADRWRGTAESTPDASDTSREPLETP